MKTTDILIVGSGCSGLYAALNLPDDQQITVISKSDLESNDSFLAQGGICMLKSDDDYDSYFEDTLKAGHYENDKKSVEIMIRSSQDVIRDLVDIGVDFARGEDGQFLFTREGAHSHHRILFHEDITGKEITRHLLAAAKAKPNITFYEYTTLLDLIEKDNTCYGGIVQKSDGRIDIIRAKTIILATGGVGGLFQHSTNYRHLTGDSLAIALRHHIKLKNIDYIQIHPTTFYDPDTTKRSFLISESVRGEGAKLYGKDMQRFVYELLPRDVLSKAIYKKMEEDHTHHVWEDLQPIPKKELESHFPNILKHCEEKGYDPEKECIPIVPAQHYFMGGIAVNYESKTSMANLYAVGETACNGVHGRNRLASNSLLEALVFAKRAAQDIAKNRPELPDDETLDAMIQAIPLELYANAKQIGKNYHKIVKKAIQRQRDERDDRDAYETFAFNHQ